MLCSMLSKETHYCVCTQACQMLSIQDLIFQGGPIFLGWGCGTNIFMKLLGPRTIFSGTNFSVSSFSLYPPPRESRPIAVTWVKETSQSVSRNGN